MNCPRCDHEQLEERVRDGVTIDACGACRGIWLDRGELEKLIARSIEPSSHHVGRREEREPPSSDSPHRKRKRSWLDIFD